MFCASPPSSPTASDASDVINSAAGQILEQNRHIMNCLYVANEAALWRLDFEQQQQSMLYYQFIQQQIMAARVLSPSYRAVPISPIFSDGSGSGNVEVEGIFRIDDTALVARKWGERKHRPDMNYDKMSRGIRQYYKKGIMKKTTKSLRLVYQFCSGYAA